MSRVSLQYRWKMCLSLRSSPDLLLGPELQHCKCICWWSFNEKCHCVMCSADSEASNGLFGGGNHGGHLGPTFPAAQTGGERWWLQAALEVVRLDPLRDIVLCQVAHYANTLFTVGVTVSRHESRWGPRAAALYQERRRRRKRERAAKGM